MTEKSHALRQMEEFFEEHGWQYMITEKRVLRGLISGDNGHWHWAVKHTADERFLMFCAWSPLKVPPRKRAAVAEFLTRANWLFHFGNFEMDWSDGQVVVRTSIPITNGRVSPDAIEHLVFANCSIMDQHLRPLLAVSLGGANPAQAIEEPDRAADASPAEADSPATPRVRPATPNDAARNSGPDTTNRFGGFSASSN